ncbi:Uu.00g141320.m01.CDS01 [Anthostomella pinea]|uniref:Uu.00g141320.m01.CDS01 n=1 Tax=Anthostomella pinea TaxID=933095 RepID=A0AAI8YJ24_9PEZI|nr:Uu.00g141320.m01.CDS01 [Anthostomella pinea]
MCTDRRFYFYFCNHFYESAELGARRRIKICKAVLKALRTADLVVPFEDRDLTEENDYTLPSGNTNSARSASNTTPKTDWKPASIENVKIFKEADITQYKNQRAAIFKHWVWEDWEELHGTLMRTLADDYKERSVPYSRVDDSHKEDDESMTDGEDEDDRPYDDLEHAYASVGRRG